jgi:hypothetical protein
MTDGPLLHGPSVLFCESGSAEIRSQTSSAAPIVEPDQAGRLIRADACMSGM